VSLAINFLQSLYHSTNIAQVVGKKSLNNPRETINEVTIILALSNTVVSICPHLL
jgi:hypothetical protein